MLLELLKKRRSIRKFEEKSVEKEKVDQLLEIVLRSPSSMGRNPWHFVVVEEKKKIEALSKVKAHGASFMKDAALAIVVAAVPEKCDVWIEDCSIAAMMLHAGACDLALGSCWVQIRERQDADGRGAEANVADIVGLPKGLRTLAIIAIGYGAEEKQGHPKEKLPQGHVHYESFKNSCLCTSKKP